VKGLDEAINAMMVPSRNWENSKKKAQRLVIHPILPQQLH
jgi:hypothetical protein